MGHIVSGIEPVSHLVYHNTNLILKCIPGDNLSQLDAERMEIPGRLKVLAACDEKTTNLLDTCNALGRIINFWAVY